MTDGSEPLDRPSGGALDGLIVLDLSRILAGPTATQLLGDLGATVIKIEHPTRGDDTRQWGPPFAPGAGDLSAYFMAANRNKRSLGIDMTDPEGQALLRQLVGRADVVIENFKPGGLEKYGLDHGTLRAAYPGLVYCSISGFGQTGPNRDKPGYDLMAQGYAGIMALTGEPEGQPMKVAVGIADVMTGMYAAVGILAALRHRDRTGEGQHIDLSLVDSTVSWLVNEGTAHLSTGQDRPRRGNGHPTIVPYQVFAVADGHVIVAVGNDGQYRRFCDYLARPELADDPRFATNPARLEHRDTLVPILAKALATHTKAEVIGGLETRQVPVGPVNTLPEVFATDQVAARDMAPRLPRSGTDTGAVQLLGNPLKLSVTPVTYRRPPPRLGEDTQTILDWLRPDADIPKP